MLQWTLNPGRSIIRSQAGRPAVTRYNPGILGLPYQHVWALASRPASCRAIRSWHTRLASWRALLAPPSHLIPQPGWDGSLLGASRWGLGSRDAGHARPRHALRAHLHA